METKKIILSVGIFISAVASSFSQDTIVKRNNDIVIANIQEISPTEIKYKRFDLPDGPFYVSPKTEVLKIKYKNGFVDNFSAEPSTQLNTVNPDKSGTGDLRPNYIVLLVDGTQLKAKIVKENKTEVVLLDNNIGERTIERKKIKSLTPEFGTNIKVFSLIDGSVITGKIVNQNESVTIIETANLGVITLPASKIKGVRDFEESTMSQEGKLWFKNPNSTRYLFAPSALCLKKGEGYYQNIYGLGNAVNFGLTDQISIGGGVVGPLGAYINAKVGTSLTDHIYIAGGVLAGNSFFPLNGNSNLALGIGFGVVTVGNTDHNITIGAGYGLDNSSGKTTWQDKPLFVANGMARVGKKFALVTENWVVNTKGDPFNRGITKSSHYETYFSYAFRYMGQRSTLDAGFLNTPGLVERGWIIGIPYIGFVIRFGKYKDE